MAQEEVVYSRSGDVLVTSARAEMAGRTFAMANITAVSMAESHPGAGWAWTLLGFGALSGLIGIVTVAQGGGVSLMLGLLMAGIGCVWWKSLKSTYPVNLGSASGESSAMESDDRETIESIVDAIKKSMLERG